MKTVELSHEELQLVRACISVAKDSIEDGALLTSPREEKLIQGSDTDKIYAKFLG